MQSIKPNIKINKLLDYSKEIKVKNNKLPKIIIIFNEEFFDEIAFFLSHIKYLVYRQHRLTWGLHHLLTRMCLNLFI